MFSYFSDCSDSKRVWVSFTSLMRWFPVSYCLVQRDKCLIFSIWRKPPKMSSAQPQPFVWEVSTSHVKLAFPLCAENCSDEAEGKYKVLTAHRRFQLIQFIGNFSTQHCGKMPAPCGGGSVPTNYFNGDSLKELGVEEVRLRLVPDRVVFVPHDPLPYRA